MNSKLRKILHIVVDVLVVAVLIFSIITLVMTLTSKATGGVPNVFGKSPIGVLTNSMHGDKPDSFDEGDLILCDVAEHLSPDSFKEGDVITFLQDVGGNGEKQLVTHRIYKVNEDGSYLTKGDNNPTYDQDPSVSVVFPNIHWYDVLAQYHGTRIPAVGHFVNLLQTQVGFFWIILFPMILFFIYQAVRVIMNAMAYSREKGMEQAKQAVDASGLTEEQKQKAIAEYLASQKQTQDVKSEPPQDPESEIPDTEEPEGTEDSES